MLDYFYLGLYKTFGFILTVLPRKITIKLMRSLAWFAYMVSKKHRLIIHTNLDLAFEKQLSEKEKKRIGIEAFVNLIDTTFGIIYRDKMNKKEVIKNVSFKNEEIIKAYQKENQQFILVTGHYGNWELLSQSIAIYFDLTLVGVGRELDSKVMDDLLIRNRERFNVEMVYKKGAMKGCIRAIGQKKIVGILTDQHLTQSQSIDVNFFNHKVTHTPLASILSRKFGIDLVPAYISTDDYQNYTVTIHPPIKSLKTDNQEDDLKTMTESQAKILEEVIRTQPAQWFWQHKRWKEFYKELYNK
ncbi:MAG: Lipid A biosynthesis lauroyl acyltransferase (EC [uncultured Sulfurovum sp.]|uniref:Lipid A biosynthesis lauroyl acyltransferase (EC) n=1 Tax=uncultured Sulfurovum sp. TaxID=269237 RepID=A0A6S6TKI8_9BACT|nr:MAG: Lipid A biosynthesis lauroyl acyltransferase (EC [uncultured Sulfurovum sp.]